MDYKLILSVILAYLVGSIPNALVIGKVFYKKDIREYGSHNLGGTNAARVLGKGIGIFIMLLDALKAFIYMTIINNIYPEYTAISGCFVCIGHCLPIFANFRGGKAVATTCGYVLAINIFLEKQLLFCFIIPMIVYLIIVFTTKYGSLASMSAAIVATITGFIFYNNKIYAIYVLLLTILIIYRHKENIKRLINNEETKLNI